MNIGSGAEKSVTIPQKTLPDQKPRMNPGNHPIETVSTRRRVRETSEKIFYDDGYVTITSSRAMFGGTTYAIATVTSVDRRKKVPDVGGYVAILLFGIVLVITAFPVYAEGGSSRQLAAILAIFGAILILVPILAVRKMKTRYAVFLTTSAGETQAYVSTNMEEIEQVIDAINAAIVARG
jgi:hypothetical protein